MQKSGPLLIHGGSRIFAQSSRTDSHRPAMAYKHHKVKRAYSDRILTLGVIPTLEWSSSFIKVTKLKTAMHIAVLLTYTESKNHHVTIDTI